MKKDIHPAYYSDAVITCSCGAVFHTGSTKKNLKVEICSQCHPFYTGKKKLVDTTGRVDRFRKLTERATAKKQSLKKKASRVKIQKKK